MAETWAVVAQWGDTPESVAGELSGLPPLTSEQREMIAEISQPILRQMRASRYESHGEQAEPEPAA
jgi:hypothetical protein